MIKYKLADFEAWLTLDSNPYAISPITLRGWQSFHAWSAAWQEQDLPDNAWIKPFSNPAWKWNNSFDQWLREVNHKEVSKLEEKNTQLENQIQELETEIQTHLQALETAKTWHENQKAELKEGYESQLTAKAQELTQTKDLNTKLQTDNKELLKDLAKANQAKNTLEQENTTLKQTTQTQQKQIQALTILAQHRKDQLEQEKQALIQLAQKKIANQKQAKELLNQLTEKWSGEKDQLTTELTQTQTKYQTHLTQEKTQLIKEINLLKGVLT